MRGHVFFIFGNNNNNLILAGPISSYSGRSLNNNNHSHNPSKGDGCSRGEGGSHWDFDGTVRAQRIDFE